MILRLRWGVKKACSEFCWLLLVDPHQIHSPRSLVYVWKERFFEKDLSQVVVACGAEGRRKRITRREERRNNNKHRPKWRNENEKTRKRAVISQKSRFFVLTENALEKQPRNGRTKRSLISDSIRQTISCSANDRPSESSESCREMSIELCKKSHSKSIQVWRGPKSIQERHKRKTVSGS